MHVQDPGDGRKPDGFNGSSMSKNGSSIDLAGPPAGVAETGRGSSAVRSPRSHMRHLSESALPSAAIAAAAAAALQTEPMEDAGGRSGWAQGIPNSIRRAPSR